MPTFMKLNKSLEKEQIREVTKVALLTNMKESSAIRSYGHSLHVRVAWVVPMVLPRAWE
jgi:hypothetical protein